MVKKLIDVNLRRMQNELQQWGQWSRATEKHCGLKQYVSPAYTLLKQKLEQPERISGHCITLTDDALIAVDGLVGMLKQSKPSLYQFIYMYYQLGWTVQYMAGQSGISRPIIDKYILAAETWLDCRLESLCDLSIKDKIGA